MAEESEKPAGLLVGLAVSKSAPPAEKGEAMVEEPVPPPAAETPKSLAAEGVMEALQSGDKAAFEAALTTFVEALNASK